MNLLSVEKLGKNFGERILFENLSFGLSKGDKMALIANNGTGKSSMLKILSGEDIADSGKVVFRNECKISYLSQDVTFNNDITINELINSAHNKISLLVKAYEQAVYNHSDIPTSYSEKLVEDLTAEMDKNNAWDYQRRSKQILSKFNINDFSQKVGILSGGQKKKLVIALALLGDPKILLLDEPFAALDVMTIKTLQQIIVNLQSENNISIILCDHQARDLLTCVDVAIVLSNCKIIASGSPSELINNNDAKLAYFGESFKIN